MTKNPATLLALTQTPLQFLVPHYGAGVLTLTLNRPEVLNAFHAGACSELGYALDCADADDGVKVVIITGAGQKAFSAGFDLKFGEQHPEVYDDELFAAEIIRRPDLGKPLIAAVNGLALGLGFELALSCDLIVASANAKFGLPEVRVGLAATGGGVLRLTRELGPKRALAMTLTGDSVTATQGLALGFVNEVTEGNALEAAKVWAEKLLRCSTLSLAATKEVTYRGMHAPDLASALDPTRYPAVVKMMASEDAHEGRRAFLERREPQWKGC